MRKKSTLNEMYDMFSRLGMSEVKNPILESDISITKSSNYNLSESCLRSIISESINEIIKTVPSQPSKEYNEDIPEEFVIGGGKGGIHIYKLAFYYEDENGNPILVPLYINNGKKESPQEKWVVGNWYECGVGEHTIEIDDNTGEIIKYGKVNASIGDGLSLRPGFHSGAGVPYAPHLYDQKPNFKDDDIDGNISQGVPGMAKSEYKKLSDEEKRKMRDNFNYSKTRLQPKGTAWAEVLVTYSEDETKKFGKSGSKTLPQYGYKFRTNTSASSDVTWYISRYMKILKVLSDEEVRSICASKNVIALDTQQTQIMVLPSNGGKPYRKRK